MILLFYMWSEKDNVILEKELDEDWQLKEIWPNYFNRLSMFYIHN